MCDFNKMSEDEKSKYSQILLESAEKFGGKNFFLQLLEAIRETKPHPLVASNKIFDMEFGMIKWNKAIFPDKLVLLQRARQNESKQNNILPAQGEKSYKKILNTVRTLKPIVFRVSPTHRDSGSGFFFQAFDVIDENKTKLNPLFDAIFFCSVDSVKKLLNYSPKA